jgi:hypothetical protein
MGEKSTRLLKLADELIDAANRLGLEVRRERILREIGYRVRGGPCRLREKNLIIIDRETPPTDQVEIIADALRERDHDQLYLSPAARRILLGGAEPA